MGGRPEVGSVNTTNLGLFGGGESDTKSSGTGRIGSEHCGRLAIRALTGCLVGDCGSTLTLTFRLWSGEFADLIRRRAAIDERLVSRSLI